MAQPPLRPPLPHHPGEGGGRGGGANYVTLIYLKKDFRRYNILKFCKKVLFISIEAHIMCTKETNFSSY